MVTATFDTICLLTAQNSRCPHFHIGHRLRKDLEIGLLLLIVTICIRKQIRVAYQASVYRRLLTQSDKASYIQSYGTWLRHRYCATFIDRRPCLSLTTKAFYYFNTMLMEFTFNYPRLVSVNTIKHSETKNAIY